MGLSQKEVSGYRFFIKEYFIMNAENTSPPKKRKRDRIPFIIIILLLLTALGFSVQKLLSVQKSDAVPNPGETIDEEVTFAVNTAKAARGPITDFYETNGEIVSASSVDVYADTQGILARIHVKLGDRVREGQILAEVDPSRPGAKYSLNPVKARVGGFITRLPLSRGDSVGLASPVATIGDLDNLQVSADIPERFISRISLGMEARVELQAWPGYTLSLTVDEIDPVVNPDTRSLGIKMNIPKGETRARAGMYASILLTTDSKVSVIRISADAVQRQMGETFVYIVEDNRASRRPVTTGIVQEDVMEIVEGLQAGDAVVVQGQTLLEDGVRVRVVREVQGPNQ